MMNDQYGSLWGSSALPASSSSSMQYTWYTPTSQGLSVPARYSPSVASSTVSTSGLGGEVSGSSRSPLNTLGLDLLQDVGSYDQKLNRDGQPAKRRGPKPDHKPAMTRRQELNRQAQRTHRQKKENYIKILEEQNNQLKEIYNESIEERDAVLEENRKLKEILRSHGIPYRDHSTTPSMADALNISANHLGNYAMARSIPSSSPAPSIGLLPSMSSSEYYAEDPLMAQHQQIVLPQDPRQHHPQQQSQTQQSNMLGYGQLGADFLLTSPSRTGLQPATSSSRSRSRSQKYHSPSRRPSP